jgi:hypothetical protein
MSKLEVLKAVVTNKTARQILLTKKHSPKILFVAGVVGVVGTTVLACRATLKIDEVLDEYEKRQVRINEDVVSETEQAKLSRGAQVVAGVQIARLYAPAIGLGVVSIAALTGSHVILTKRNGTLMATVAGLDRALKEYRTRVADTYGKDIDRRFATGEDTIQVSEKMADGKTKETTKKVAPKDGRFGGSIYAVQFDESSQKWSKEPGRNAMTLAMIMSWANDKLRANGHITLNEVYDMLDLPRTKAGFLKGWVYRGDNEPKTGDNYVSFGIFDGDSELVEGFIDGDYPWVTLDFNVDAGAIYDNI